MATILIVDDEAAIRGLAKLTLLDAGHSVLEASNGLEAVGVFRSYAHEIDLVVMDMMMPVMDGAQAIARIRETRPDARIICVSGYTDVDMPQGTPFLRKPFLPSALLALVAQLLRAG